MLILGALVLTSAAWLRSAEYDEQYTLFLTAGTARPDWPDTAFAAGTVAAQQAGHATLTGIARDLRATDVHPPLYFWTVSFWRHAFGPSLFAARMLSVLCGVLSLSLIGMIARRSGIDATMSTLLTLGCYGFVYTNAIARGFAPALMLTLAGLLLLQGRRPLLAGLAFGAACCCNYLAVFIAAAVLVVSGAWIGLLTAAPFLALDAWFFAAQHGARAGQFPPFEIGTSLLRIASYQGAAVFGGLPLYSDGKWRLATEASIGLLGVGLALVIARSRPLRSGRPILLLLAAAIATPFGLLLLGAAFDNTPIELRYLSFGLPFIALLVAWAAGRGTEWPAIARVLVLLTLATQTAGIVGLMLAAPTMQPARATAAAAARLVKGGIVLLPRGNDGVGIVGAFGIEAPATLSILLVRPTDPLADRIVQYDRIALATLAQDNESIAAIAMAHTVLTAPNWRRVAIGSNLEVYQRTEKREQAMFFEGFTLANVPVPGGTIRLRHGGSGPPLLLLHGNPQTHAMWHLVAPALAKRFTVICPDLRGYGFSLKPPATSDHAPYAKIEMAKDMTAVMDHFGFDQFCLAGHDRGARLSHRIALDNPARVQKLAVLDIIPTIEHFERADMDFALGYYHWFWFAQPHPFPEWLINKAPEEWWRQHTSRDPSLPELFHPDALSDYFAAVRQPEMVRGMCEDYRAAASIDLRHDRASRAAGIKIRCPMLALWGAKGKIGKWYDALAVWQKYCTETVIGGPIQSGHYIAEESPAETLEWFGRFFT